MCCMQLAHEVQRSTESHASFTSDMLSSLSDIIGWCDGRLSAFWPIKIISWQPKIGKLGSPPSSSTNFGGGFDCGIEPTPMSTADRLYCRRRIWIETVADLLWLLPCQSLLFKWLAGAQSRQLRCLVKEDEDDQVIDDKWSSQLAFTN